MRKHSLDLTSLLAGLVFVALAGVYLLAAGTGNEVDASWVLPIALVGLGAAGLVGGITRAVRRPDESSTATATTDRRADTDDHDGDTDSGTTTDGTTV